MKPITGRPLKFAVWPAVATPVATFVTVTPPAALDRPVVGPVPMKPRLAQPFWNEPSTVTDSELTEPRTPDVVADEEAFRMLSTCASQHTATCWFGGSGENCWFCA